MTKFFIGEIDMAQNEKEVHNKNETKYTDKKTDEVKNRESSSGLVAIIPILFIVAFVVYKFI